MCIAAAIAFRLLHERTRDGPHVRKKFLRNVFNTYSVAIHIGAALCYYCFNYDAAKTSRPQWISFLGWEGRIRGSGGHCMLALDSTLKG